MTLILGSHTFFSGLFCMATIVIYLNFLGSRQAVSVRPTGLSCVEAVKDWVASLRPTSEPFEVRVLCMFCVAPSIFHLQIAGIRNLSSGQTHWAGQLPDNLGLGIAQELLEGGADYEIILSARYST